MLLRPRGIVVEQHVAYHAVAADTLDEACVHALKEHKITGASFFSPRSATLAMDLLKQYGLTDLMANIDAYCLSLAVAQAAVILTP